jgi:hypothetical protein
LTGLLPEPIRTAVTEVSTNASSTSFTLAAFIVVVALLLEHDLLLLSRKPRVKRGALTALAIPLGLAVTITLVARIALLAH